MTTASAGGPLGLEDGWSPGLEEDGKSRGYRESSLSIDGAIGIQQQILGGGLEFAKGRRTNFHVMATVTDGADREPRAVTEPAEERTP